MIMVREITDERLSNLTGLPMFDDSNVDNLYLEFFDAKLYKITLSLPKRHIKPNVAAKYVYRRTPTESYFISDDYQVYSFTCG